MNTVIVSQNQHPSFGIRTDVKWPGHLTLRREAKNVVREIVDLLEPFEKKDVSAVIMPDKEFVTVLFKRLKEGFPFAQVKVNCHNSNGKSGLEKLNQAIDAMA